MRRAATTITGPKGGLWDVFIGLEVHAQIKLCSKLFSRSEAAPSYEHDEPNTRVSLFDAAFPGTLPVLNESAVDQAVRAALALSSNVNRRSVFERKHYYYSDLPHGYQITQQRQPIATGGSLPLIFEATPSENTPKGSKLLARDDSDAKQPPKLHSIGITRIQLEVDSGKSVHGHTSGEGPGEQSLVDLNRAGIALMEIVFEPEIRSAAEAGAALRSLQLLLRRVGACDGNMEEGSMRCDLNVSVRPSGSECMGERVEVKNMNSVKYLMAAATAEARRQAWLLELGEGAVERETRSFDLAKGETVLLRRKEGSVDYRFFPEPDLPPLVITDARVEAMKATLPELPEVTIARLSQDFGLSERMSRLIVCAPGGAAGYFEGLVNDRGAIKHGRRRDPKVAANWLTNNLFGLFNNELGKEAGEAGSEKELDKLFPAERLGGLLDLLENGTISSQTAKTLLRVMVHEDTQSTALQIVNERNLRQITDRGEIEELCRGIIEDPQHAKQLARYRGGKKNLAKFFMGQAFKATGGRADGDVVEECIMRRLQGSSDDRNR